MKKMMRLDKILANMGYGSRKEVKELVKKGEVKINREVAKQASIKVDAYLDIIEVRGEELKYREFIYLMLNKPKGYISATEDDYHRTVIELLDEEHLHFGTYPVGRLDIDTTGLLILTNDGDLTHKLISPKSGIIKKYLANIDGRVTEKEIEIFEKGIYLAEEDYTTLPAKLEILSRGQMSTVHVYIQEGKYHQVKRMFESVGMKVLELKRLSMGEIELDTDLEEGEYRELNQVEMNWIYEIMK